jgi:hypothetical protein
MPKAKTRYPISKRVLKKAEKTTNTKKRAAHRSLSYPAPTVMATRLRQKANSCLRQSPLRLSTMHGVQFRQSHSTRYEIKKPYNGVGTQRVDGEVGIEKSRG